MTNATQAPKPKEEKKEVIFISTSRRHMITLRPETHWPDGKIRERAKMIIFDEWGYHTSDPAEIAFIRALPSYTKRPPKVWEGTNLSSSIMPCTPVLSS